MVDREQSWRQKHQDCSLSTMYLFHSQSLPQFHQVFPFVFEQAAHSTTGIMRILAADSEFPGRLIEKSAQLFDFAGPHNSHPGQQLLFRALKVRAWPLDVFELAKVAHIAVFRTENVLQDALDGSPTRRLHL